MKSLIKENIILTQFIKKEKPRRTISSNNRKKMIRLLTIELKN